MSTYLKKGIRPAVFIIVLLLLLQGLSYFFITRGNGNKNALSVMKQPENSIDYLVIGDSESYSSISPMEIWIKHGFAGYNCGVVGQQAQYTYYLAGRGASETGSPGSDPGDPMNSFAEREALRSWNPRRKIWRRNIFLCSSITTAGNGSVSARFRHLSRLKRPLPLPM